MLQRPSHLHGVDQVGVGLHVAPGEGLRVAGRVHGGDQAAPALELLGYPGGPGEQVEGRLGP